MAKTTAPLLSFGAAGQIGKTQVYSTWKGRSYARRYTTPANPRSTEQTLTRDTFSWLQAVYKLMPALASAPWELFAKGKVLTARNAFTQKNLAFLREEADVDNLVFSPGALGGQPPASINAVGGSGSIQVTFTPPATSPLGWTFVHSIAAVIRGQDPQSGTLYTMYADQDTADDGTITIMGLTAGAYQVGGWYEWMRPDGLTAYSPSIQDQATAT